MNALSRMLGCGETGPPDKADCVVSNAMASVTDDQVAQLLRILDEAARATTRTTERFVAPRVGVLEQVSSRRHHFVLGRRGVGKSTLLRKVEKDNSNLGMAVAYIDLETLRGIPYPDVVLHLCAAACHALQRQLRDFQTMRAPRLWWQIARARRALRKLERTLKRLLQEPQIVEREVRRLKSSTRGASFWIRLRPAGLAAPVGAGGDVSTKSSVDDATAARFTQTKMEGLFAAAPRIREVFAKATAVAPDRGALILLDDFYHVGSADQPHVLAYLNQIFKNLDIYLKVGAVKHRLVPFVEGDPPTGLQVGHDASEVDLDVTLESFPAAQAFLERVLGGLVAQADVELADLITDTGRTRLVLASGGVARDYLSLTARALRSANDREGTEARPHNRITAEDVNEVSRHLADQKQADLRTDAGPNADAQRERFSDLVTFCLDRNRTNVFLVENIHLRETRWGRELEALADLRFVHRVAAVSIQSSSYRGRLFTAFTLDLSSYTGTRTERIRQIEFWTPGGRQQLRRAGLIYRPGDDGGAASGSEPPVDWEQPPLPGVDGAPGG